MSDSFIYVKPSEHSTRVKVKTELNEGVEIPVYTLASSDGELIDKDNPSIIALSKSDVDRNSMLIESIDKMVIQLKILNMYMAEGFDETITEEDIT